MQQKRSTHLSVERALQILMAFTPYNEEMKTVEVVEKVGFHKSTVNRLLHVLADHGFLQQDSDTKKYSLGNSVTEMARAMTVSLESRLFVVAQPYIEDLRNIIGEKVTLEVFSGTSTILALRAAVPRSVQVSFRLNQNLPVAVSAGSRAVTAFLHPNLIERMIPQKIEPISPDTNSHTNRERYLSVLADIRELGVAFESEEGDVDMHAVAAPVFNQNQNPSAAVVITAPADRKESLHDPNTISLLKETAAAISEQLQNSKNQKVELNVS
jgi:IclR family KDG regulon transcriptional repressor